MPNLKFLASNVQPTPICLFSIQLHDATIKINEKKATVLVGLDLSAAFDTINHDVLINHLESQFGVDSGASSWLRSYLTDRQQFVKLCIFGLYGAIQMLLLLLLLLLRVVY